MSQPATETSFAEVDAALDALPELPLDRQVAVLESIAAALAGVLATAGSQGRPGAIGGG